MNTYHVCVCVCVCVITLFFSVDMRLLFHPGYGDVTTIFCIIFLIFLLSASTTPFIFGLHKDEFGCLIFHFV